MRYLNDQSKGLLQKQKVEAGEIVVQLLPEIFLFSGQTKMGVPMAKANNTGWLVKTTLVLPAGKLSQQMLNHLNIDIRDSFEMIQGTDTLPCLMCDRIPGIRPNEYTYLMSFGTANDEKAPEVDWRLQVKDSMMGLSPIEFVFRKESINQFIAITN